MSFAEAEKFGFVRAAGITWKASRKLVSFAAWAAVTVGRAAAARDECEPTALRPQPAAG